MNEVKFEALVELSREAEDNATSRELGDTKFRGIDTKQEK
jgi:hypothetical protein